MHIKGQFSGMSFCSSGIKLQVLNNTHITIKVERNNPLIKLSNQIDWQNLMDIVLPDLKKTTSKLKWWLGRKLKIRIHLAVYVLQEIFDMNDRETEKAIKENAVYRVFCGETLVDKWHCPDHTKIEEFRSRLSPDTQNALANETSRLAVELGFGKPCNTDIDSTIQEANIAYPNDVNMMLRFTLLAKKVADYMNKTIGCFMLDPILVSYKEVKKLSRKYFFSKYTDKKEEKTKILTEIWCCAFDYTATVRKYMKVLLDYDWVHMPKNIKKSATLLQTYSKEYFMKSIQYVTNNKTVKGKLLSLHAFKVEFFNKNKPDKKHQFGRAFQLGRIDGNFLFIAKSTSIRMPDADSLPVMLKTHEKLFGTGKLKSISTDKAYYSKENEKRLIELKINPLGLQKPGGRQLNGEEKNIETELSNRRSGIEPLIGHTKHGGQLDRSRMKSDNTTESAAYRSVGGFNFRQMLRYLGGEVAEIKI